MMRPAVLVACLLGLAVGSAFAAEASFPCKDDDRACAYKAGRDHPAKTLRFWEKTLARPLEERFGVAPPELVELVTLDNIKNGFPNRPRAAPVEAGLVADVRQAFHELPQAVKRSLDAKLAGIYFLEDIGGTGFADEVVAPGGKRVAAFIILDPVVLRAQTANAWATWKESSPFGASLDFRLVAQIEDAAGDNRKNAIQYILLHELGHVVSVGTDLLPSWNLDTKDIGSTSAFTFFPLSWRIPASKDRFVSVYDDFFRERERVVYYFGAKLAADRMQDTYEHLERTNFPTLYAATHPADDFAETFANYVHVVMLHKPFAIRIEEGGRTVKTYGPCWAEARCAAKRALLEGFLGLGR